MHTVENALIRVENPHGELDSRFERIRADLNIYVLEFRVGLSISEWENMAIQVLNSLDFTNVSFDQLVLYVETEGNDTSIIFSCELVSAINRLKACLEHYTPQQS